MANNINRDSLVEKALRLQARRHFLAKGSHLLGGAALASLLGQQATAAPTFARTTPDHERFVAPHFAPKAKRVIYLHMVGGPSQIDLFEEKPKMKDMFDKELPESIRNGQRLTTMTSGQKRFPVGKETVR